MRRDAVAAIQRAADRILLRGFVNDNERNRPKFSGVLRKLEASIAVRDDGAGFHAPLRAVTFASPQHRLQRRSRPKQIFRSLESRNGGDRLNRRIDISAQANQAAPCIEFRTRSPAES